MLRMREIKSFVVLSPPERYEVLNSFQNMEHFHMQCRKLSKPYQLN